MNQKKRNHDKSTIPQPHAKFGGRIPAPEVRPQKIRFSFEFVDFGNEKFTLDRCADGYFHQFFDRPSPHIVYRLKNRLRMYKRGEMSQGMTIYKAE